MLSCFSDNFDERYFKHPGALTSVFFSVIAVFPYLFDLDNLKIVQ